VADELPDTQSERKSGSRGPKGAKHEKIVVGASCQELPTIAALHKLEPNKPIVCFNLKLDTLRGDLGLPAFPSRNVPPRGRFDGHRPGSRVGREGQRARPTRASANTRTP
jgi:hypothetical protein